MIKKIMALLLAFMSLSVAVRAQEISEDVESFVPVFMPEGSKDRGREAFIELKCMTCHTVYGEAGLPAPVSDVQAPQLWAPADQASIGWLLNSIVSPSHQIPERYQQPGQEGISPMQNFTEVMTVQQLIDLVAFLRDPGTDSQ